MTTKLYVFIDFFRIKILDTINTTLSINTQTEIYKNIVLFLQGLLKTQCTFISVVFVHKIIPFILQNRFNSTEMLHRGKLLHLSEKYFPQFWLSRRVNISIFSATNTKV